MPHYEDPEIKKSSHLLWVLTVVISSVIVSTACLLSSAADADLEATRVSIQIQQTMLSHDQSALTQAAQTAMLETSTPDQIVVVPTADPATPMESAVIATETPTMTSTPTIDELDERTLKSARILLFEDMSASGKIRIVKEALDSAGYFYLDVGSAKGWFKTQLSSNQEWDLIIAAAEADRNFGGEYFELIDDRIQKGASAVIEYRDLDSAPAGKSKPMLDRCGVKFQSDWFEPDLRVFYILEPDHPIFHQPNRVINFRNAPQLWKGDVGDLVEIKNLNGEPAGDAKLLLGTNTQWKTDHGLLVNCIDGRLTIQLFASHEYQYLDVVSMWQNYVYQALKSRFRVAAPPAPTPVITMDPAATPEMLPTEQQSEVLVDPTLTYSCGGMIDARLTRWPSYQKMLFEHNASGEYMILRLEMINNSDFPIQVWDDDYSVEGNLFDKDIIIKSDKAATGYLYIEGGGKLYQDRIEPGVVWRTQLAFDLDPRSENLELVVRPGDKFDEKVCEVRIPIP